MSPGVWNEKLKAEQEKISEQNKTRVTSTLGGVSYIFWALKVSAWSEKGSKVC